MSEQPLQKTNYDEENPGEKSATRVMAIWLVRLGLVLAALIGLTIIIISLAITFDKEASFQEGHQWLIGQGIALVGVLLVPALGAKVWQKKYEQ